jgi:uncharacterized protein YfaQ (DUF2300 family)
MASGSFLPWWPGTVEAKKLKAEALDKVYSKTKDNANSNRHTEEDVECLLSSVNVLSLSSFLQSKSAPRTEPESESAVLLCASQSDRGEAAAQVASSKHGEAMRGVGGLVGGGRTRQSTAATATQCSWRQFSFFSLAACC